MPAVLAAILEVVGYVLNILQIVQQIRQTVADVVQEHVPYHVEHTVDTVSLAQANPTTGLVAAKNHRDQIQADIAASRVSILAAIAGIPSISTQPTWYVPPPDMVDTGDIANAVWGWVSGRQTIGGDYLSLPYGQLVEDLWSVASYTSGHLGLPLPNNPFAAIVEYEPFKLADLDFSWTDYDPRYAPAVPDWSQVLTTDSPVSFLVRTQPTAGWTDTGPTGVASSEVAWINLGGPPRGYWIRSTFSRLDMLQLQAAIVFPPVPPQLEVAPVWPGLANVTLGSSVALSAGVTVTASMHGVIVEISSVAAKQMFYTYHDVRSYRHIGALAFLDDQGHLEGYQALGFTSAIYTPRSMARAEGVKVMSAGGTAGTVTPWALRS